MTTAEREQLIGPKEAREILGVSQQRVSQLSDHKRVELGLEMGGHLTPAMKLPGITLYKRSEVLALAAIRAQQAKSNHRYKTAGLPDAVAADLAAREARAQMHSRRRQRSLTARQKMRDRLEAAMSELLDIERERAEKVAEIERLSIEIAAFS